MSVPCRLPAALTALALLAPAMAPGQGGEEPRFEEEIVVTEVLLDALVTDRAGNIVLGLEPADFVVEEGGEPVELTGATFYSHRQFLESTEMAERLGVDRGSIPQDRYFILFFDDPRLYSSRLLAKQLQAGRDAREWIESSMLANDHVAVASYLRRLRVYQDFTHDRAKVLAAIELAARGADPGTEWPSRRPEAEGPSLLAGLPTGKALRKRTARIYDGLRLLADAARPIPGRKNLILFSTGFGLIDELDLYQPDSRYYPPMTRALNAANVAVYAVDMIPAGVERPLSLSLARLAADTNGRYFNIFTSFLTPLREVGSESDGYYLLSYRSERPLGASGYQQVRVSTRNPEFRVRARAGYAFGSGE